MTRLGISGSRATAVAIDGREYAYFGGCGYLGLAHAPRVVAALRAGAARHGVSSGASRETSGDTLEHEALEADLARHLRCEAALLLPEGYTANLALAQALASELDVALIDEHAHPSLFDAAAAARLGVSVLPHADMAALRARLREHPGERALVMSDSVFPALGELAPLAELIDAVDQAGALLVLDDCHGTGVIGASGRGALEHAARASERVIVTSTLSKALGCYGGFVAGARRWIEQVRERSQVYIGTTPIPPALAAAARVALALAFDDDLLVRRMRANAACLRAGLERLGLPTPRADLPVFPFALESAERTHALHAALRVEGLLVPYVRYPGGPADGVLRAVVGAAHESADIERLVAALAAQLGRPA